MCYNQWDCISISLKSCAAQDRRTGRSRGFGYVTFSTSESAEVLHFGLLACFILLLMGIVPVVMVQKALAARHTINGRELEVKVATPKVYIVSV